MKLDGKVAVVTGGARGIGLAIAQEFAKQGARVCIADIDKAAPDAARDLGRDSFSFRLDVTRLDSIDAMVEEVKQRAGRIDILVNNAAIFDMAPIGEITEASFDRIFAVNVKGLLFTLQAVAREMIAAGAAARSSTSLPRPAGAASLWLLSIAHRRLPSSASRNRRASR